MQAGAFNDEYCSTEEKVNLHHLRGQVRGKHFPMEILAQAIFTPGTDELQTALRYAFHIHNTNDSQARFKVEPVIDQVDSEILLI
ncbi:hypothetical protein CEXT_136141 [Caerostris extrusa]|uniref:Uncharacterized protein n=1 Tax=Caerostris extrusa TaxID=172846 RepID=A0AAV4SPX8_CAEEX|nr:hypothetical protein CEXT_136141 [Caerostris extrusa]